MDNLVFSVSATTRPKRAGEIEGINYFFKSKQEFKQMIEKGELIEWAEFVGNFYGTPKKYIEDQVKANKDIILEIEVEGAKQIKQILPNALFIFLAPPSIEVLYKRLKERSTESEEKILARVEKSKQELQEINQFENLVINEEGKIEETAQSIIQIIQAHRSQNKL